MYSLRFGRLSRGWVFMGFYSVTSAVHVFLFHPPVYARTPRSPGVARRTGTDWNRSMYYLLSRLVCMLLEEISAVAQIKFLAAEALHRVGGLVFVAHGNCSANGLRKRDYVTGEMWKNKPSFRVVLNKAVSDDIARQCKHYTRRGVINFVSLVLKLVRYVYHLDSLCQPCFRVSLVSQHLCPSRQHQQQCPWRQRPWWSTAVVEYITPELVVFATPAVAVIAAPASVVVHRASVCRVIRGIRVLIWKIEESIEARYQASLKWRRIQMEDHTLRIRAISHGMELWPFTWLRELYRNSQYSKPSRATSLMKDVRGRLANNLRLYVEHCRWNRQRLRLSPDV